ncbi:VOC family protein [Halarchaeum sp. CBA1220]|uniref:VOC family protein n=1 Tax=Halarchaeum sp. CBA1220 TaxID=1853682 RepID=UPI000F3A7F67|nr:VOC family protein [Halarchaeum sp. CBA1220]QLC34594.1 VOC family protein [Halarchaeum sp. CBA1220]
MDSESEAYAAPAGMHVGRVALTVGSLDAVLPFYRDGLGFAVERADGRARLRAGDRTRLVLVEDADAPARPSAAAGLYHVAIRVPDRPALAAVLERVRESGHTLSGASDHGVSEALYLRDPEGNGIEVYRDRPRAEWPRSPDGTPAMGTRPLDLSALAADAPDVGGGLPDGTDVGHVHLEVRDLDASEAFYAGTLGLAVQERVERAVFAAAGGYHHHVACNTWQSRRAPADSAARGLRWVEFAYPDAASVAAARERLPAERVVERDDDVVEVTDPDGIRLRLVVDADGAGRD